MYIKSLQCLFDKYKTRFGLKESDVLQIQWKGEGTVLNLWTAAASSEPRAPFPTSSNLGAWLGLNLDWKIHTWAHMLKKTLLSAQLQIHTHTHSSFSGNGRFENGHHSLLLASGLTVVVQPSYTKSHIKKRAYLLSRSISQWRLQGWTVSVQRGVSSTRLSWKVTYRTWTKCQVFVSLVRPYNCS